MTTLKYLDAVLRYLDQKDYTHRENVAILISDIFEENKQISEEEFIVEIKKIRNDFFRINKIDRPLFAKKVLAVLKKVDVEQKQKSSRFEIAQKFITRFLELGYNPEDHKDERAGIFDKLKTESEPHTKLVKTLDCMLGKMNQTYQLGLHGVKEYSGVDLVKKVDNSLIGFQIKSVNDDISEDKIRAQTSKALEYKLDGFVWLYGRPPSRKVDDSVQAAFHYFLRINQEKTMFASLVMPEVFAELLMQYNVAFP